MATMKLPKIENKVYLSSQLQEFLDKLNPKILVTITDARGIITFANEEFVNACKYTQNELVGQNHRILKSGHQHDELFEDLWVSISNGKVWQGIIKNRAKDSSYFWVDTLIISFFGKNDHPEKYVSLRTLVSAQHQ